MVVPLLTEKYGSEMYGVLNCYDRVVISGNLHPLCYAKVLEFGQTAFLVLKKINK